MPTTNYQSTWPHIPKVAIFIKKAVKIQITQNRFYLYKNTINEENYKYSTDIYIYIYI
jgi:hypothetical protein